MTKIINQWHANVELPSLLKKVISEELLSWKDTAEWNDRKKTVEYELISFLSSNLFRAQGKNYFIPKGSSQTIFRVTCSVDIYPENIPRVPRLISSRVKPALEKIIEAMLRPNITSLGSGLKMYIKEHSQTIH